ncbi:8258_t:CDS:2, partial [Scutellospora calospora]
IKRTFTKSSLKNYDIAKISIMNKLAVIKELDELIKHLQQPAINPKQMIKTPAGGNQRKRCRAIVPGLIPCEKTPLPGKGYCAEHEKEFNNDYKDIEFAACLRQNNYIPATAFQEKILDLSDFVNLKELNCSDNKLSGSLKTLQNLTKLKVLNINDTDIDSGLEYLPESVKYFSCSAYGKDAKCKIIYNLFADKQGKIETK